MNICTLGFLFILRTTIVGVLHEPTNFQVVSAHSTFPKFNRILVLVFALVLVLSVLSLLSFHPLLLPLPCLPLLCLPLHFATHQCPFGHFLLGVMNLPVSRNCLTSSLTVCFVFFFSKHHAKSILHGSTVRVSRDHLQQSFKGTNSNVFRKIVCIFLSISSATIASHEIFHLFDGAHQFRPFRLRRRQNLPQETSCSSRCVWVPPSVQFLKPWSPPVDMTTSKLSPSVRADNTTKNCPSITANVSTPSSGTPIATVDVVTTSCDSAANAKAPRTYGTHQTRSF